MSTIITGDAIKSALVFASKDAGHYAINGVRFERERLVATDGKRLVVIDHEESSPEELEPFTLDRAGLTGLTKRTTRVRVEPETQDNGSAFLKVTTNLRHGVPMFDVDPTTGRVRLDKDESSGSFPKYEEIFPTDAPTVSVMVDPKLLGEALLALDAHSTGDVHRVTLELRGEDSAIVIVAAGAKALVMPVRS